METSSFHPPPIENNILFSALPICTYILPGGSVVLVFGLTEDQAYPIGITQTV